MFNVSQLLAVLALVATSTLALPTENASAPVRDDLTTDYAKQIIRQSKVAEMKGMLNANVAPCDDFYNYACGNWHRQNPAQLFGNIMTDTFRLISKGFDRRLQRLLQSGQMKSKLEETLQSFYQSCQLVRREDVHYRLALQSIYREYGEFPVLAGPQWNASDFTWWRTVADMQHKYGRQIIVAVDILKDIKNHTLNRVYLGPPESEQIKHPLLNDKESSVAEGLSQYFSVEKKLAKQTAKEVNQLEQNLLAGTVGHGASLEDDLNLYTVAELEQKYAEHINITEFLGLVLGHDNVPEHIYVYSDSYLNNTLLTLQTTPTATIANYVLWNLLETYLVDSKPSEMRNWCTEQTRKYFGKLTEHLIYERYRSPQAEAEVHSVWNEVRDTFRQQLAGDNLDWITNMTRQLAIEKLDRMQLNIKAYDNENFDELYGDIELDKVNFVHNLQQVLKADAKQKLAKSKNGSATMEPLDVLSFTPAYSILDNNITMPVAMLQPRYLWDADYPQALKYGTLGYLLAHEMIHGFDDEGRSYDGNGNLAEWWDYKSSYEFEEKRKCFQAQYHNYKYGGAQLPETRQQAENIADNAGIKLAYKAYQRWLDKQPPAVLAQETLANFELNNRQLFFLSFAQLWCDDVQTLFQTALAKSDSHAPSKYRVIGTLSNFQEFSWVFNCSQQAPMDPEFKCAIY